jgi:hypothetical protein
MITNILAKRLRAASRRCKGSPSCEYYGGYVLVTTCAGADGDDIQDMIDNSIEVTYPTILHHCEGFKEWIRSMGYGRGKRRWIQNDWSVSYHKSHYKGRPCYYVKHSAIEYVWVKRNEN